MSASERLKALDENYGWPAERTFRDALPEIITVVEAAETIANTRLAMTGGKEPAPEDFKPLNGEACSQIAAEALAALDAKLADE